MPRSSGPGIDGFPSDVGVSVTARRIWRSWRRSLHWTTRHSRVRRIGNRDRLGCQRGRVRGRRWAMAQKAAPPGHSPPGLPPQAVPDLRKANPAPRSQRARRGTQEGLRRTTSADGCGSLRFTNLAELSRDAMKSDSQDPDFRFLIISIRPWAMGTARGVLAVGTIVAAHAADAVPAARDGLAVLAVRAAVAVAAALAEHAVHGLS